jgi:signal peptidase I
MGKRSTKHIEPEHKQARLLAGIFAGFIATLLIGGPSVLHYVWGVSLSPVLTASMVPHADPGDVLISIPTPAAELKVGDVIAITNPKTETAFAHRIVEIRDLGSMLRMTTKGDANPTTELDPFMVAPEVPVQKEVLSIKWIGAPLAYLNSDQGRQASISLIVVANVGFIFLFLQRKIKPKE